MHVFHVILLHIFFYLFIQNLNNQSVPIKMISVLKCAWRQNFIFFEKKITIVIERYKINVFGWFKNNLN